MSKHLTKTAALRLASDKVGPLQRVGRGQWAYFTWSREYGMWVEGVPHDYPTARRYRTLRIAETALELLGCQDADIVHCAEWVGTPADIINQYLEYRRAKKR